MIRSDQILSTVAMIQEEKLDVRAVTLGVSLLDCRGATPGATAEAVDAKLRREQEAERDVRFVFGLAAALLLLVDRLSLHRRASTPRRDATARATRPIGAA